LTEKEEKAVNAIQDFSCSGGAYVGVSWGKDSVVVADIALRHGINLPLIHLYCIPSHNKNCDLIRDMFLAIYQGCTYREYICDYSDIYSQNLPPDMQDKETDKIWFHTWRKVEKDFPRHITGVRGKESRVRRIRMHRWGIAT
jgi:phosphoadenosine phosphosulfate reductase